MTRLIPDFIKKYLIRWILKNRSTHLILGKKVSLNIHNTFEGYNSIGDTSSLGSCSIGYATYIASGCNIHYAKIGKFCAIGKNVQICLGKHPIDYVSIHPAFYSLEKQSGFTYTDKQRYEEHEFVDDEKKYVVDIGNDVWIGNNVMIMDGITVGDGAIIASGAIVTKDVPAYSIVMGQPARVNKFRFSEEVVKRLLEIEWWNWEPDYIRENSHHFMNTNDLIKFVDDTIERKK